MGTSGDVLTGNRREDGPLEGQKGKTPTDYLNSYEVHPDRITNAVAFGRGRRIRTADRSTPSRVLYQTELYPENVILHGDCLATRIAARPQEGLCERADLWRSQSSNGPKINAVRY